MLILYLEFGKNRRLGKMTKCLKEAEEVQAATAAADEAADEASDEAADADAAVVRL